MSKLTHPPDIDLVSTTEAAEILDRHVRTIHRLVNDGQLTPVAKVPGKTGAYMFHRADVLALRERAAS